MGSTVPRSRVQPEPDVVRSGLSEEQVARARTRHGRNEIRQRARLSVWASVGEQLRDPLVVVLLVACLLTLATGDLADTVVIAIVVVVNTGVGVAQALKADRAIAALAMVTAPRVRVRRKGIERLVPASDLVPGDVVLLGEGDIVPADCELVEALSLMVDESMLTGESVAVAKTTQDSEGLADLVSSGTVIVKGRAVAVVRATGSSSAIGRIATLVDSRAPVTPLQQRLAGLGRTLALVATMLCTLVLVLGVLRGQPLELMLVTAVSLAVAAVPESLPAVVTMSLALGARRMAARHAVVRRLPAVETLGAITVLATDKTGTLTRGVMVVEELWTPEQGEVPSPPNAPDVRELLVAAVLCNDARLVEAPAPGLARSGLGDPTEVALLAAAAEVGLDKEALDAQHPRLAERPFESQRQQMTTVHELPGGGRGRALVVSKGSVESLSAQHGYDVDARLWAAALARAEQMAARGLRVLALTTAVAESGTDWRLAEHRLVGLVAMDDPAKATARSTIERCQRAGITPVLITGDHPATAMAVAEQVGILAPGPDARVVTGPQIAAGESGDLTTVRVFARTTPEQKLVIVEALQAHGEVVAMTGDGVNDAPALRRSDIGVAMGLRGTEVARQASDLVLADDDLETLVAAVEEGRRVYANIRQFLVFGLSGGAAEIAVMLAGPPLGLTAPLLAAQILWINLLTHGLTGVAIGAEPADPRAMRRPPRVPGQSILGSGLWQRVLLTALVLTTSTLALAVWAHDVDRPWQTMLFVGLTSAQLGVACGLRHRQLSLANPLLLAAVTGSALLALAGVYLPLLQVLLGTTGLGVSDLLVALTPAVAGWAIGLGVRRPREPQISSGSIWMAPEGHSATQRPHPLQ